MPNVSFDIANEEKAGASVPTTAGLTTATPTGHSPLIRAVIPSACFYSVSERLSVK